MSCESRQIELAAIRLHVAIGTSGQAPLLMLHGLLYSGRMFEPLLPRLDARLRPIRPDFRGQGRSEVTRSGYDMDTLAADMIALIEALDLGPVHLLGFSMGGFVALRIALARPELLRSLALLNTSAEAEPPWTRLRYRTLNLAARWLGLAAVIDRVEPIMFSPEFLADPARRAEREAARAEVLANDPIGVTRAVAGVVSRAGLLERLDAIRLPTLVVASRQDAATPLVKGRRLAAAIPAARSIELPGGHMSTIEQPQALAEALNGFYAVVEPPR